MNAVVFSFPSQERMVRDAVRLVAEVQPPQCCCLVVPPGFGPRAVARQVAERLRTNSTGPLLAEIEADALVDAWDFVTQLHEQWRTTLARSRDLSPEDAGKILPLPSRNLPPHEALKALLDALPADPPAIAVLGRFHKILDRLDQWVLAQLRATEEKRRLRTVTVAPLPYTELKKRWRENHPLTVSDYGDKHAVFKVDPAPLNFALEQCRTLEVPAKVAEEMVRIAGGYPEPMIAMLEEWHRRDRTKDLRPELKRVYRNAAETSVERLIDWLDPDKGDIPFCEAVIDLYQAVEEERARDRLSGHPYETILLDGDGELRAECVGGAAVRVACQGVKDKFAAARKLYERRQYVQAKELLNGLESTPRRLSQRVLHAHARLMAVLYDEQGADAGMDTEWKRLKEEVAAARKLLAPVRGEGAIFADVEERYDELEKIATTILNVARENTPQWRVVDDLVGLVSNVQASPEDRRLAFLLLVREAEVARNLPRRTNSCLAALALPEQIFRVWAFCQLGLNYYKAPDREDVWQEAEKYWPAAHGSLRRAVPGAAFPSLPAFAYFAQAQYLQQRADNTPPPLEENYSKLQKAFSQWDQVRTASAHALVTTTKEAKERYFQLIDNWLDRAMFACCHGETRQGLLAVWDPLPLVDDDGNLSNLDG